MYPAQGRLTADMRERMQINVNTAESYSVLFPLCSCPCHPKMSLAHTGVLINCGG